MLPWFFAFYLCLKVNGEDGGRLGGPAGIVMVMMTSPLLLLPSEQILIAERNTSVVLKEQHPSERNRMKRREINILV